ncbi:glucosamine-6-phosphate deaminase [Maribacter sp.]|nr:glucosamine-6-phosphate deaminase [Maribacter sp.]
MKKNLTLGNLNVLIYATAAEMGKAAADSVAKKLNEAIRKKEAANLILATGASQFSFLKALKEKALDWQKITVFHLDEYKGIADTHPASFRNYLKERILDHVNPKMVYLLDGDAENLSTEIQRYTDLLLQHPIDVACIGIGENGHIAFNDPPTADFKDPKLVKLVTLDQACRNQQLGEGWFPTLADVPEQALTLTIPAIMSCNYISCVVPDERKAAAVYQTLYGAIGHDCPSTILRTHPNTKLFLDTSSAAKIK